MWLGHELQLLGPDGSTHDGVGKPNAQPHNARHQQKHVHGYGQGDVWTATELLVRLRGSVTPQQRVRRGDVLTHTCKEPVRVVQLCEAAAEAVVEAGAVALPKVWRGAAPAAALAGSRTTAEALTGKL